MELSSASTSASASASASADPVPVPVPYSSSSSSPSASPSPSAERSQSVSSGVCDFVCAVLDWTGPKTFGLDSSNRPFYFSSMLNKRPPFLSRSSVVRPSFVGRRSSVFRRRPSLVFVLSCNHRLQLSSSQLSSSFYSAVDQNTAPLARSSTPILCSSVGRQSPAPKGGGGYPSLDLMTNPPEKGGGGGSRWGANAMRPSLITCRGGK